jgi:hypothetical protein
LVAKRAIELVATARDKDDLEVLVIHAYLVARGLHLLGPIAHDAKADFR